jgi:hypothetical protein
MSKNLDAIRAKLRALRAKTVENGCTEEEALAAADKMAELLSKHGLTTEELDAVGYGRNEVPLGRRSPLDQVWFDVARFADCRAWYQRNEDGKLSVVYFGRPQDTLVAEYVYGVLKDACARALADFRASDAYKHRRTNKTRAHAVKAFHEGLSRGLRAKLWDGLWKRYWTGDRSATGALITSVKNQLETAMKAEGVQLGTARPLNPAQGKFIDAAQLSGSRAAAAINVNAGVGAKPSKIAGFLG